MREDEQEVVDEEVLAVAALSSPLLPFSPTHPALASLKMLSGPMTPGTLPPLPPTALALVELLTLSICSKGSITIPSPTTPHCLSSTSPEMLNGVEAGLLLSMLLASLTVLLAMLLSLISCVWCGVAGGVEVAKAAGELMKEGGVGRGEVCNCVYGGEEWGT